MVVATATAAPHKLPALTYPFADQTQYWVNSTPLSDADLRGKPVLVFFWTYSCYNCHNSLEWINAVHANYGTQGLQILGIHSPEFDHEKDFARVADKTKDFGIAFPVMIDNDFIYWRQMQNNYWPAFYLYDSYGQHRGSFVGEVHLDTPKATEIEQLIQAHL